MRKFFPPAPRSLSRLTRLRSKASTIPICLISLGFVMSVQTAGAQQESVSAARPAETTSQLEKPVATNSSSSAENTKAIDSSSDTRYRIGPGDVLDIKVFNKPQFNREGVKVDPRGMIRMPLVKEEIKAACKTEDELATEVTTRLKEFLREPQVIVQIKDYQAEPVAVLGQVRAPSRFLLQRRARLLELITLVNGPTDTAGRTVQVVHTGSLTGCEPPANSNSEASAETRIVDYYKLEDTLRGDDKSNPYVRAGDVISIPAADQVYVIGNVIHPATIALTESMTVSRAIAMAGGTALDTKKSAIRIVRQTPGSTEKKEIVVDLDAVNRQKAEDVVLVANDIIDVPASGGKRLFRSLLGAVVPSIGQLPVRVVP
jgi:polysaccharide export outer membrane protein